MNILVRGVNSTNKGADLLLSAVTAALTSRISEAKIVVRPFGAYSEPRQFRDRVDRVLLEVRKYGVNIMWLAALLPNRVRRSYGWVLPSEIDVVIDASGFTLGDQWGRRPIRSLLSDVRRAHRQQSQFFLMPQAMGPFASPRSKRLLRRALRRVEAVFARDPVSEGAVRAVLPDTGGSTIRNAPDITIGYKVRLNAQPAAYNGLVDGRPIVIPNARMVDKAGARSSSAYLEFLVKIVDRFRSRGLEPVIMNHEGVADRWVVDALQQRIPNGLDTVEPSWGDEAKWLIGRALCVVTSRFHGLVNALSAGVPALATGWSHKYQELLNDFGCPDMYISDVSDSETLSKQADLLIARSRDRVFRDSLLTRQIELAQAVDLAWDHVCNRINERSRP